MAKPLPLQNTNIHCRYLSWCGLQRSEAESGRASSDSVAYWFPIWHERLMNAERRNWELGVRQNK